MGHSPQFNPQRESNRFFRVKPFYYPRPYTNYYMYHTRGNKREHSAQHDSFHGPH